MPLTGRAQYLHIADAASFTGYAGIMVGGNMDNDPNVQDRRGIGAQHWQVGGSMAARGSASIALQDDTFVSTANNIHPASATNPVLNAMTINGGVDPLVTGADGSDYKHTGAKVDTCTFSSSINNALVMAMSWIGTGIAEGDTAATAPLTDSTFEWFRGTVTVDGRALLMQSFNLAISNNLEPHYSMDVSAGTDDKRMPDSLKIGARTVAFSCDLLTFPGTASMLAWILADAIDRATVADLLFKGGVSATESIRFTLANLACTGIGVPFEAGDGAIVYPVSFAGEENAGDTITIAAA